jgi:hypothetical protein
MLKQGKRRSETSAKYVSAHVSVNTHADLIHKAGAESSAITSASLSIRRDGTAPKGPTEAHNPFFPIQIFFSQVLDLS